MKIEKGKEYKCIRTVLYESVDIRNGTPCFIKGKIYESDQDGCLIDEIGYSHRIDEYDWRLFSLVLYQGYENDPINPDHYKSYSVETIDMMIAIYGKEKVAIHCELTAFKYRQRLGKKDNLEQDLGKEKWYLDKAKELRNEPS